MYNKIINTKFMTQCPNCETKDRVTVGGKIYCASCGALWVPDKSEQMKKAAAAEVQPTQPPSALVARLDGLSVNKSQIPANRPIKPIQPTSPIEPPQPEEQPQKPPTQPQLKASPLPSQSTQPPPQPFKTPPPQPPQPIKPSVAAQTSPAIPQAQTNIVIKDKSKRLDNAAGISQSEAVSKFMPAQQQATAVIPTPTPSQTPIKKEEIKPLDLSEFFKKETERENQVVEKVKEKVQPETQKVQAAAEIKKPEEVEEIKQPKEQVSPKEKIGDKEQIETRAKISDLVSEFSRPVEKKLEEKPVSELNISEIAQKASREQLKPQIKEEAARVGEPIKKAVSEGPSKITLKDITKQKQKKEAKLVSEVQKKTPAKEEFQKEIMTPPSSKLMSDISRKENIGSEIGTLKTKTAGVLTDEEIEEFEKMNKPGPSIIPTPKVTPAETEHKKVIQPSDQMLKEEKAKETTGPTKEAAAQTPIKTTEDIMITEDHHYKPGDDVEPDPRFTQKRDLDQIVQTTSQSKSGFGLRAKSLALTAVGVVILGAYIWQINYPSIALRVASARAGINVSLPDYMPSGWKLAGDIRSEPGKVSYDLMPSINKNQKIIITQARTDWDSQALAENYLSGKTKDYTALQSQGLTIYIYEDNQASWINHGSWYKIEGKSNLIQDQIIKIATSL
ncbi:MAG: DUF4367 domain-containing protein [bacterium]|nr:DUF4367 domain-containing protein [bacterium]